MTTQKICPQCPVCRNAVTCFHPGVTWFGPGAYDDLFYFKCGACGFYRERPGDRFSDEEEGLRVRCPFCREELSRRADYVKVALLEKVWDVVWENIEEVYSLNDILYVAGWIEYEVWSFLIHRTGSREFARRLMQFAALRSAILGLTQQVEIGGPTAGLNSPGPPIN